MVNFEIIKKDGTRVSAKAGGVPNVAAALAEAKKDGVINATDKLYVCQLNGDSHAGRIELKPLVDGLIIRILKDNNKPFEITEEFIKKFVAASLAAFEELIKSHNANN